MNASTQPSAADIMIWLGTVTKLKGKSNVEQWFCDMGQVLEIIDPEVWDLLRGIGDIPKGPIKELDVEDVAEKADADDLTRPMDVSYPFLKDWELWHITKPRERYRKWLRNRAIARHALSLTIDPSLRHLIDHVPLPQHALLVLMIKFRGGFKHHCSYFDSDYFDETPDEHDNDNSDDKKLESDSSDQD